MLAIGVFLGSIGFPVIFALCRYVIGSGWRAHKRLAPREAHTDHHALFVIFGWLAIAALEWKNQATLGDQRLLAARCSRSGYMSVMTRSGGLGIIDLLEMNGSTLLVH